jgi:hypothetical protein
LRSFKPATLSNDPTKQKAAEREIAERLQSAIRLTAEIDQSDKPDFILKVPGGRTIGLEVTTYQSGKSVPIGDKGKITQRKVEAAWEHFECASKTFRSKNADLQNIAITFWFNNIIPPKEQYDQLFMEIRNFILLKQKDLSDCFSVYSRYQFTSPLMVKYFRDILVNIHKDGEWNSNKEFGFVNRPATTIAGIIGGKARKVKSYRKTDEIWLVIQRSGRLSETVLPIGGITEFNENPELRDKLTNGPFSRVYVFTAMGLFQWDRLGGWQNV